MIGDHRLATIRIGSEGSPATDVDLHLGSGCTLTNIYQSGGALEIASNVTLLSMTDGTTTVRGAAALTTLTARKGTVYYESTGTIGTLKPAWM